jgi:hypothetical protein
MASAKQTFLPSLIRMRLRSIPLSPIACHRRPLLKNWTPGGRAVVIAMFVATVAVSLQGESPRYWRAQTVPQRRRTTIVLIA